VTVESDVAPLPATLTSTEKAADDAVAVLVIVAFSVAVIASPPEVVTIFASVA
jgi:hypothetical protein